MNTLRGTQGYALICDNLLGYSPVVLQRLLNLYALLYDSLVVSDSWLMTNASLQHALQQHSGVELLRSKILIPARRDTVSSFQEFYAQSQQKKMYGLCATPEYVQFLDQIVLEPQIFSMKQVAASYTNDDEQSSGRTGFTSVGHESCFECTYSKTSAAGAKYRC